MIEDDISILQKNQKLLVEQTQMYLQKLLPNEIVCLVQTEQYYFVVDKTKRIYTRKYDMHFPELDRQKGFIIMDDNEESEYALKDSGYKYVVNVEHNCGDWPPENNTAKIQEFMHNKTEG